MHVVVNLVPVMEVEVHRQYRSWRERVRRESAQRENAQRESCLIILLKEERRYTRITLGSRSQGVEQFVRGDRGTFVRCTMFSSMTPSPREGILPFMPYS